MNKIDEQFLLACARLSNWCMKSHGHPIDLPSGDKLAFRQVKTYTDSEINTFSSLHHIVFPSAYRHFLKEVGSCECFMDQSKLGIIFFSLEKLSKESEDIFQNAGEDIFPNLLLAASLTRRGDYAGFDIKTTNINNFAVFSHEDDPDHWIEETLNWVQFEEWIIALVESEGEKDLPQKKSRSL
jgi:hypothetical protein